MWNSFFKEVAAGRENFQSDFPGSQRKGRTSVFFNARPGEERSADIPVRLGSYCERFADKNVGAPKKLRCALDREIPLVLEAVHRLSSNQFNAFFKGIDMAEIHEIAPDVFRLSIYYKQFDLEFNHFLVRDEQPLLFHAGFRSAFPELREAVSKVIDPGQLRWIGWSHFESDECGALNQWLEVAPNAEPVCTLLGKMVSVDDFSNRPARGMSADDVLTTGRHQFRFTCSPHIPHGWDAGVMFDETDKTFFCSDLFHHFGKVEPMTQGDIVGRTKSALEAMQKGPLIGYLPYTCQTERVLRGLAELNPKTLAVMHGSSFNGDCAGALGDLAGVLKEAFDE
jgi:hypothetical protein